MQWKDIISIQSLSCFFISSIIYLNSLNNMFCFDDISALVENEDLRLTTPWVQIFTNDFWGTPMHQEGSHKSYRPLTVLSFRLNYIIGELNPLGFHLVNILLHGLVTLLFTACAAHLSFYNFSFSFCSGLLFAIHPIHTEAVSGVVGRAETLSAVFYLLAFIVYANLLAHPSKLYVGYCLRIIIFLALIVASALSKEIGITVVAIISVYDIFYHEEINFYNILPKLDWISKYRKLLIRLTFLASFTLIFIYIRIKLNGPGLPHFVNLDNPASVSPTPTRQLTYLYLCFINTWLLLFPFFLCPDWTMNTVPLVKTIFDARNVLSTLTIIIYLTVGFWSLRGQIKDRKIALIGLAFMIFPYIPASNLFFPVGFVVAERILYIPSMGFCMLVALGGTKLMKYSKRFARLFKFFFITICVCFCAKTFSRNFEWKDDQSLFTAAIKINSHNAKLYNNLGHVYEDLGNFTYAESLFRTATQVQADDAGSWINLGRILKLTHRLNESEVAYKQAINILPSITGGNQSFRIAPGHLKVYYNYANLLSLNSNRYDEAEKFYKIAIKVAPNMVESHINYGDLFTKRNMYNEAIEQFDAAIKKNPKYTDAYFNKASIYLRQSDKLNAEKLLRDALSIESNHFYSLINLALIMTEKGDLGANKEAIQLFERVLAINATEERALFNLGLLYSETGEIKKSQKMFEHTLQVNPTHKSSLYNLGLYAFNFNNYDICVYYLEKLLLHYNTHLKGQHYLGDCYMQKNMLDLAELQYKNALKINPKYTPSLHNMGILLARKMQFASAIKLFEEVLALEPNHESARSFLNRAKSKLGN